MWFPVYNTPDGGPDGLRFSLTSSTYTVSAQLKPWATNADPSELRGPDGCWTKHYRVPEGTMQASLAASQPKLAADACWPNSFSSNATTVSLGSGSIVEFRVPEPSMLPIQVRSPEGNLVAGATLGPQIGQSADPVWDAYYSFGVGGQTVGIGADGANADVPMYGYSWISPDGQACTSGSKMAYFGAANPDVMVKGVLRFAMPDGGLQQVRFTDSLADGSLDATLPYSVPETTLEVPGQAAGATALASGGSNAHITVTGGGPAVLTAVLADEASGSPVANAPVVAESFNSSTFVWSKAGEGRTAADGRARVSIAKPISTTYRIRPAGVGTPARLQVTVNPVAPSAVSKLKAKPGRGRAELQWKAPANLGGAAITGYLVQWRKAGKPKWATKSLKANQRAWVLRKLKPGITYQYRVQAINAAGHSSWTKGRVTPTG